MARLVLALLLVLSSAPRCDCDADPVWTLWQRVQSTAGDLARTCNDHLVPLLGQEKVDALLVVKDTVAVVMEEATGFLRVAAVHVTELLKYAGYDIDLSVGRISLKDVISLTLWSFLASVGFKLRSLLIRILSGSLRLTWFSLRVALAMLGFFFGSGLSFPTTALKEKVTRVKNKLKELKKTKKRKD